MWFVAAAKLWVFGPKFLTLSQFRLSSVTRESVDVSRTVIYDVCFMTVNFCLYMVILSISRKNIIENYLKLYLKGIFMFQWTTKDILTFILVPNKASQALMLSIEKRLLYEN